MAKNPDIRVLVGTKGAGNVDGASGKLIQKELNKIARGIKGDKMPKVKFAVDVESTTKKFKTQLNNIAKGIKGIPVKITFDTSATKKAQKKIKDDISQYIGDGKAVQEFEKYNKLVGQLGATTKSGENISSIFNEYKDQWTELQRLITQSSQSNNGTPVMTEQIKEQISVVDNLKQKFLEVYNINKSQARLDIISDKNKTDLKSLLNQMERYVKLNDRIRSDPNLSQQYNNLYGSVSDLLKDEKTIVDTPTVKKFTGQFTELRRNVRDANLEGQTFFKRLSSQAQKLGVYLSGSAVIYGTLRQIKQMTNNVIELDSAMTELKKVTNETDATYTKFLKNAETRAKSLGATLSDTVTATADFARLGYALQDAEKIADASLVYKNVGDGISNISDASESIISTMKAFNVEASNAMSIVDKFNYTGK